MKKQSVTARILSWLLSFAVIITTMFSNVVMPVMASEGSAGMESSTGTEGSAGTEDTSAVTVYLSISWGKSFYKGTENGPLIMNQKLTVPYFDLALYGLEEYYYSPEAYSGGVAGTAETADGVITLLHVFIAATEIYKVGIKPENVGKGLEANNYTLSDYLTATGGFAGAFIDMWEFSYNLNYYLNYEYQLGSPKIGATCNQIAVKDGDYVTLHGIKDSSAYGCNFTYFKVNDSWETAKVNKGDKVELTLSHSTPDYENYTTNYKVSSNETVYYVKDDGNVSEGDPSKWTELGTTNENGVVVWDTKNLEAGTYYVGSATFEDTVDFAQVVPGVLEIQVVDKSGEDEAAVNQEAANAVIAKIKAIGTVTLDSKSTIAEARKAYEALTADQKKLVTNGADLTAAEAAYAKLVEAAEKEEADKKAEAEKVEADKKKASAVVTKIKAIGTVTLKSESKIKAARKAYNALTADQKKYISNTDKKKLTNAEKTLKNYQEAVKKGKKVTVGTNIYKITKASLTSGTVEFVKPTKTTQKSVKVPDTVKLYGVTYKVTSIGSKAFQKNKKLTSVSIGKNVTSIGSYAFDNCSKLTKLTLPSNVTKIGSYAFKDCKKLKTLTIQSKKMTSKTINKKTFSGVTKTTTIKVASSKKKAYTKLFRKCGLSTKVKVK